VPVNASAGQHPGVGGNIVAVLADGLAEGVNPHGIRRGQFINLLSKCSDAPLELGVTATPHDGSGKPSDLLKGSRVWMHVYLLLLCLKVYRYTISVN
jgi:hypothetical protein